MAFGRKVKRNIAKKEYNKKNKKILSRYRNFFNDFWSKFNNEKVKKYERKRI
ncbi:MAG: hypothetical protein ACI4ON_00355 [Clostridia bacterium]